MLNKVTDVIVDPRAPWAHDVLGRERHGEIITRLVQSTTQPYVIAISGGWGTGKTTFLRQLEAHLEMKGVPSIRIDAWKSDYLDDPLVAFIAAVSARLEQEKARLKSLKRKTRMDQVIASLAEHGAKLIEPSAKLLATALIPGGSLGIEAAAGVVSQYGSHLLERQKEQSSIENRFKDQLSHARDALTGREGGMIRRQMVVLIDELDRCRPDYAIKVLERIKHYFDVRGIVFVLATDPLNLPSAVESVYGPKVQGQTYLRKFIDFDYDLPSPEESDYLEVLMRQFATHELLNGLDRIDVSGIYARPEGADYLELYHTQRKAASTAEILNCFPYYARHLGLSLRDQSQAFTVINAFLRSTATDIVIYPQVLAYCVCLRFAAPDEYRKLWNRKSEVGGLQMPSAATGSMTWLKEASLGQDIQAFQNTQNQERPLDYVHERIRILDHSSNEEARQAYQRLAVHVSIDKGNIRTFVQRALQLSDAFRA